MLNCYLNPSLDHAVPRAISRTDRSNNCNHAAQQRHGFLRCEGLVNRCVLTKENKQQGFTLIELIVVVGLLAVMSTITLLAFDFSSQAASEDVGRPLAQSEMVEIAKALKQYKRDTGNYPEILHPTEITPLTHFEDVVINADDTAGSDGLDDVYGTPSWDIDTGRGWRGPYLELRGFAFVDVTGLNGVNDITKQYAKADAFVNASNAGTITWTACNDNANPQCAVELGRGGSPYLLFGFTDADDDGVLDDLPRRIVSMGADGEYGGVNANDGCSPNTAVAAGEDDLVLCL